MKSLRNIVAPFAAPYINIETTVVQPGITNGKPNIKTVKETVVAPTAKKIGTFITNQIFGSDLLLAQETENVNWVMPALRKTLENAIYSKEGFVYIHSFEGKIYLESICLHEIHNLVQKWDKIISCTIIQDTEINNELTVSLFRNIKIEKGFSYLTFEAFKNVKGKEQKITLDEYNKLTNSEYQENYILPYEVIINIDSGTNFFENCKKLLNEEMKILNVIMDEVQKTRTRIATSQHFQSGDITTSWTPANTGFKVDTLTVKDLQDYFTLLPGDKEHKIFEFMQGDLRIDEYERVFKFYDYQIIQSVGLSTASFGYEKDAYMNIENVDLSKNATDMTIEALKTQIAGQIENLFTNIIKAQRSLNININKIPDVLEWDYGLNEKFDDLKKLTVVKKIQGVADIPQKTKYKIIMPILKKLIESSELDEDVETLLKEYNEEVKDITVKFGEI